MLDIQPAWLWLDTRTLLAQFGYDRLRYFQPLRTIFESKVVAGGGSDHMQKIGALRAVNPYDPFLGMWVTITRRARGVDRPLHPEEALTREQAIRFYTANNAFLMFLEDQVGTLEPGKLADFIILDRDLLTCPVEEIRDARPLATYLNGKVVYERARPDGKCISFLRGVRRAVVVIDVPLMLAYALMGFCLVIVGGAHPTISRALASADVEAALCRSGRSCQNTARQRFETGFS